MASVASNANLMVKYFSFYSVASASELLEQLDPVALAHSREARRRYEQDAKTYPELGIARFPAMVPFKANDVIKILKNIGVEAGSAIKIPEYYRQFVECKVTEKNPEPAYYHFLNFHNKGIHGGLIAIAQKIANHYKQQVVMLQWLRVAGQYFFGGGLPRGLFTRMSAAHLSKETWIDEAGMKLTFSKDVLTDYVNNYLRVKTPDSGTITLNVVRDIEYKVPSNSSAGFPVPVWKKGEERTIEMYLKLFSSYEIVWREPYGKIVQYFMDNQHEACAILNNKVQIYALQDLNTKVRPFYSYPFALSLWFSKFLVLFKSFFHDIDDTVWAVGFSYAHGGVERLMKRFSKLTPGKECSLFYGDDQLFAFGLDNGKVGFASFDISHMDMSLRGQWKTTIMYVVAMILQRVGVTLEVTNLIKYWLASAFAPIVLYSHSIVGQSYSHLHSGVVGTTEIDTIAASLMKYTFDMTSKRPTTVEEIVVYMTSFCDYVKLFGFTPKYESIVVEEVDITKPFLTKVYFLGQRFRFDGVEYWPVPDEVKLFTSMVVSPEKASTRVGALALCERAIGIVASGGWTNELLYYVCKGIFDDVGAILAKEAPDLEKFEVVMSHPFGGVTIPSVRNAVGFSFPSVDDMKELYCTSRRPKIVEVVSAAPVKSVAARWADIEEDADLNDYLKDLAVKPNMVKLQHGKTPNDVPHSKETDIRNKEKLKQKHADRDKRIAARTADRYSKQMFASNVSKLLTYEEIMREEEEDERACSDSESMDSLDEEERAFPFMYQR